MILMEYVYAAMLLHTTSQEINEGNVTKILEAAGAEVDEARVKALIAALEDVDIEEAMEKTAVAAAAPAAAPAHAEHKKEDKPHKEEKKEEEAAAGLGALFG